MELGEWEEAVQRDQVDQVDQVDQAEPSAFQTAAFTSSKAGAGLVTTATVSITRSCGTQDPVAERTAGMMRLSVARGVDLREATT